MKNYQTTFRHLLFCGFVFIISGCSILKNNKSDLVKIKVLDYGRSSAKLLYTDENKSMPSGEKRTTDYKLNILESTDKIKLLLLFKNWTS